MPSKQPLRETACPDFAELVALYNGALPPERVSEIVLHLSNCPKCEATYRQSAVTNEAERKLLQSCLKEPGANPDSCQADETQTKVVTKVEPSVSPRLGMDAAVGSSSAPPPVGLAAPCRLGLYEIKEQLGGGGMGTVYRAFHIKLKKWVALKVVRSDRLSDAQAVSRFQREMEAVGRLDHPNIVRATDAGEDAGVHYLVMEWVDGIDLASLVRSCGPLPLAEACALVCQAAAALQCAHLQGLVHRDIKPSNLLLSKQGILKLLDLGLARLVTELDGSGELTVLGQMMGTADYTAPEQWVSSHDVDIRADLYSLGCTLYTLVTGKPPFSGPDFDTLLKKMAGHLHMPAPPVRRFRPDVPEALAKVLARLLAKKPAERYSSPAEVGQALEPFAVGADLVRLAASGQAAAAETPAKPLVPSETPAAKSGSSGLYRRNRLWFHSGVAVLLGIVVTVLLVAWWPFVRPDILEPGRPVPQAAAFEPGVSYELLERKPQELHWPDDSANSFWHYQGAQKPLLITCTGQGLIQLAKVRAQRFDLELTFSQTPWVGGVGVFFRGHDEGVGRDARWAADMILLERFNAAVNPELTPLFRGVFVKRSEPRLAIPNLGDTEYVTYPQGAESRLKVTVGPNGLEQVFWNGRPAKADFCKPIPGAAPREGADGSVGILVQQSNVTLHSARLFVHPPGNQP